LVIFANITTVIWWVKTHHPRIESDIKWNISYKDFSQLYTEFQNYPSFPLYRFNWSSKEFAVFFLNKGRKIIFWTNLANWSVKQWINVICRCKLWFDYAWLLFKLYMLAIRKINTIFHPRNARKILLERVNNVLDIYSSNMTFLKQYHWNITFTSNAKCFCWKIEINDHVRHNYRKLTV